MALRVAVVDPLPMFQQGVSTVLSAAGYVVDTPSDVVAWAQRPDSSVVLLTVRSEHDWDLLGRLCGLAGAHNVIAVVEGDSAASGARAVRAGARSVLPRDVADDMLRHTVAATIGGQAVMPAAVAAALTADSRRPGPRALSDRQADWLRQLAAGVTVERLAAGSGYSERAMYRHLNNLYRQMGVKTRVEAIVRAQESGRLGPVPSRDVQDPAQHGAPPV